MQFPQYIAELGRFGFPGCEGGAVDSAQGADQGVPVLSADSPFLSRCRSSMLMESPCQAAGVEKVRTTIEFGSTCGRSKVNRAEKVQPSYLEQPRPNSTAAQTPAGSIIFTLRFETSVRGGHALNPEPTW